MVHRTIHAVASILILSPFLSPALAQDNAKVGLQPDGRIIVPTNQVLKPAGTQITFPGRPVSLLLIDDGKTLVVQNKSNLLFIDAASGKIRQTLASSAGLSVIGLTGNTERVYTSDAKDQVRIAERQPDGAYKWGKPISLAKPKVDGAVHPAGMAVRNDKELWVASTRGNNVQQIDLETGKVKQVVPVGVAPFTIVFARPDRAYVSNWGGDHPAKGDPQAPSSKTPVKIDPRTSVGNHGSVSVLAPVDGQWKQVKTIPTGLHPSGMVASKTGKFVYVANANSDTVSVIDTAADKVIETINCRPENRLPFGSGCNALALSPLGHILCVANGSNNCIAVVRLGAAFAETGLQIERGSSSVIGLIPTGWYPGAIQISDDSNRIFVANIKGHGSLDEKRAKEKGKNSHDHLGSISIIDVPKNGQLAKYTADVNANNRLAHSLAGLEKPRPGIKPAPIPERHGEPSVFEHVIYIIKENRTYDQVFGDIKEGNGDPNLVMFGEKVTPNHHALARQFTLFDNFYCSGVLSADGHSWVNTAYVTDYLERSFGGFTRSYPYEGSDPLAFAPTGALWDNALLHKKTFRNYGEHCKTTYTPGNATWSDIYADFKNGTRKVKIDVKPNMASLNPFSHPNYPGFPLKTPDVYRAKLFLDELDAFEKKGAMPNLLYVFLPCDHTNGANPGSPTPKAMVADNDLAVGRIVEAVSKSKFWPKTCIFIVEDDPQNGFDHVDGHRTVALVVSPYTKRKAVDSTNYNQTGMVKTIELILGLPPMNQLDLSATPMRKCFQAEPDLTPFTCLPNTIPLDEMNPSLKKLTGKALYWAKKSLEMNFDEEDQADEDTLNRILWHATRGYDTPYPAEHVGRRSPSRQHLSDD
jgi:YVTN family beta-propeller protein